MHIVLFEPEIPPNTGNIIRLVANTGTTLHLVEPLGFSLDEKQVRRAGLDYHALSKVKTWQSWDQFRALGPGGRLFTLSTRADCCYTAPDYGRDDVLVFGPETRGLPEPILMSVPHEQRLRIPMVPGSRSLNLANAAAVVIYEALRQQGFPGLTARPVTVGPAPEKGSSRAC